MIIKFDRRLLLNNPAIWDYIGSSFWTNVIFWILHSKYRQSKELCSWLREEVRLSNINTMNLALDIETSANDDEQMIHILRYIRGHMTYLGDSFVWKMEEYWQTPSETSDKMTGDCEDGAILMYALARLKGIPANRLMIMTGDMPEGGHCWLAYKPDEYPLNWVFLDWCYDYDNSSIEERDKYYIEGKVINRFKWNNERARSSYLNLWFAFNEERSHASLSYNFKGTYNG